MAASGKGNNKNAVIEAIRKVTWSFEVDRRAKGNARVEVSRARDRTPSETLNYNDAYTVQYNKIFKKTSSQTWYPIYWLSFLLIGFAAGEEGKTVLGAGNETWINKTIFKILNLNLGIESRNKDTISHCIDAKAMQMINTIGEIILLFHTYE